MSGFEILKIIGYRDSLRLNSPEEVLHDRVRIIAERDLDRALKAMNIWIVASTLVGLVFLHQRNKLFGGPAFSLEVIVVGSGGPCVHLDSCSVYCFTTLKSIAYHKVDGRSPTKNIGTRHHSSTASKPFGWLRVVEGGRLRVKLHVARVNTGAVDPYKNNQLIALYTQD